MKSGNLKFLPVVLVIAPAAIAACVGNNSGLATMDDGQGGQSVGGASSGGQGGDNQPGSGGQGGQGGLGTGGAGVGGQAGSRSGGAAGSASGGAAGGAGGSATGGTMALMGGAGGAMLGMGGAPPNTRRAFVAVGYGGIRALSVNEGQAWTATGEDAANGGDDMNLLRSVAYGNGLWVAGGWNRWYTAPDGATWTRRTHNFGIIQGMAFGNGFFLASEMQGAIYRSDDGIGWRMVGRAGTGKHTELVFGAGKFAAWGEDNSLVETSTDGVTWTRRTDLSSAAFCGGADIQTANACFGSGPGIWAGDPVNFLRAQWKGIIQRSSNGRQWTTAWTYPSNAFDQLAFGYVPM